MRIAETEQAGLGQVSAVALTGIADLAVRERDAVRAATLLGAAEGVRGTRNRSGGEEELVAGAARALLRPADYDAAFQRGQAVSLANPAA